MSTEDEYDDYPRLFWSMTLSSTPNKKEEIKELNEYKECIIHITNACFGPKINNNSRTIVMANDTPICVLSNQNENQSLDIILKTKKTILSLNGQNISNVYLTGYQQIINETKMDLQMTETNENEKQKEKPKEEMCYKCRAIKSLHLFDTNQKNKSKKICIKCIEKEKELKKQEKNTNNTKDTKEENDNKLMCSKCNKLKKKNLFSQKERIKTNKVCFECNEDRKEQEHKTESDLKSCSVCGQNKSVNDFSKRQRKKPADKRKCKKCIENQQNK